MTEQTKISVEELRSWAEHCLELRGSFPYSPARMMELARVILDGLCRPIDMVLPCPRCGTVHVDTPAPDRGWTNPPHRSHLCHACGWIWRPADVATNGVASVKTRGDGDSPAAGGGEPVSDEWLAGLPHFEIDTAVPTVRWYGFRGQECDVWVRTPGIISVHGEDNESVCIADGADRGCVLRVLANLGAKL